MGRHVHRQRPDRTLDHRTPQPRPASLGEPTVLFVVPLHRCDWEGRAVVAVHNLGDQPAVVRVRLGDVVEGARLDDLLDERGALTELDAGTLDLKMDGYGFRWFRLLSPDQHTPP